MAANDIVKKVAMFLVGFTLWTAFLLALSCANYSIKRFQLPVERVGLFINITKNTMELAGFIAVLIGNIIIWLSKGEDKDEDGDKGNDNKNSVPKIGSLFTNWLMFVMSIMSLVAYKSGGDSGNLNFYFWTIVLHVFVCAINFVFSIEVDVENVSYIYVGQQLFSIFVSVYHNIFLYFANKYEMNNIDYWIVYGQMVIMIIFTCATALLWTYSTYSEPITIVAKCFYEAFVKKSGSQATSQAQPQKPPLSCCCCCCCKSPEDSCCCPGHQQVEENECRCCCCKGKESTKKKKCNNGSDSDSSKKLLDEFKEPLLWSPAMIYIFANGTLYSVYPGVSPYQLVSADVGYKIGLIILLLSPIIPIAICILDMESIKKGPSKKWENGYVGWHALWAGPIYAIICIILSFYTLHYPESMIGRSIYGNNILVGLLTVSFVVVLNGLQTIGPTATNSQVDNKEHKGTVTTIIHLISLVLSNIFMFLGDGYLQTFRKYSRDNWPTKGYTRYRGFKFWLGSACKVAVKSILNVFNSDIRARLESFS